MAISGTSDGIIKTCHQNVSFVRHIVCCSHGRTKNSPLTIPLRWVACKGGLCFNPPSRVAQRAKQRRTGGGRNACKQTPRFWKTRLIGAARYIVWQVWQIAIIFYRKALRLWPPIKERKCWRFWLFVSAEASMDKCFLNLRKAKDS